MVKLFLSWSGERSKAAACIINTYSKAIINDVDPFFSPDIEKGTVWFNKILSELHESDIGMFFLTPDNRDAPWLFLEMGAIAAKLHNSRVYTILIGINETDVKEPFPQYQNTKLTKDDLLKVFISINKLLVKPLEEKVLERSFNGQWASMEKEINDLDKKMKKDDGVKLQKPEELLTEILTKVRNIELEVFKISGKTDKDLELESINSRIQDMIRGSTVKDKYYCYYPDTYEIKFDTVEDMEKSIDILRTIDPFIKIDNVDKINITYLISRSPLFTLGKSNDLLELLKTQLKGQCRFRWSRAKSDIIISG
ncbi:MAG: hypothetical protein V1934_08035 [Methanobacteriota archaeon]